MKFLSTFGGILIVALIPIVLFALTKCGVKGFNFQKWLIHTRTRLLLGLALIVLLAFVIVFVPEAKDILTTLGFNAEQPAALGLTIGGLLVAGIRGNDEKTKK